MSFKAFGRPENLNISQVVFTKIIERPPAGEKAMSISFPREKSSQFIKMLPSKSWRKKHWKKVKKGFAIWLKTH